MSCIGMALVGTPHQQALLAWSLFAAKETFKIG
jgi:hypothetical protein